MATAKKAAPKKAAAPKETAPKKAAPKKAAAPKETGFILKSTSQKNLFVHYTPRVTGKDHAFRLQLGMETAHVFEDQDEVNDYLETLPEVHGLETVEVEVK